ncbi:hypothetical protein, partial [Bacillus subtilis]|uniref:hypothetical protein n=1 Tax=Bacillus subtilis TaxID=1423 RepID=UPI001A946645
MFDDGLYRRNFGSLFKTKLQKSFEECKLFPSAKVVPADLKFCRLALPGGSFPGISYHLAVPFLAFLIISYHLAYPFLAFVTP